MLDALAINCRGLSTDTEPPQERLDDLVALVSLCGQAFASLGKLDWLVRLGDDEPITLQPTYRVAHGGMRDRKVGHQIDRSAYTSRRNRIGDRFDVVLGHLARVVRSCPLVFFGRQWFESTSRINEYDFDDKFMLPRQEIVTKSAAACPLPLLRTSITIPAWKLA